MHYERVTASDVGIESMGQLFFETGWKPSGHDKGGNVFHAIDTQAVYIDPDHVLHWHNLWNQNKSGLNSDKRFRYMMRVSSFHELDDVERYEASLHATLAELNRKEPPARRLQSLVAQAEKYQRVMLAGERITRLDTGTVRINFGYEPPIEKAPLHAMREYLLGLSAKN